MACADGFFSGTPNIETGRQGRTLLEKRAAAALKGWTKMGGRMTKIPERSFILGKLCYFY